MSIPWYSEKTDRSYATKEELVAAEAHGWVVLAFHRVTGNVGTWGIWPTKREAVNAMNRLKTATRKEDEYKNRDSSEYVWRVRPLWMEGEERLRKAES